MKAIWKGAISFGLINIPVNIYNAAVDRELKFVLLHKKDLSQIRYAKICKNEEKEIPYSEIVKGYELEDGKYVVLTEEDFASVNIEKSKTIEIQEFTEEDAIDTIYYEKLYYLEPGKNAGKPYHLFLEALKKSKKVAVAKFVLRNHVRVAIIKPYKNMLILNQIRLQDEILPFELSEKSIHKISEKEVNLAIKLIDQLTGKFTPEEYKDNYVEELKALIDKKSKGGKIVKKGQEPQTTKVHDIMSLLKESLEKHPSKKAKKLKTEEKAKKETKIKIKEKIDSKVEAKRKRKSA